MMVAAFKEKSSQNLNSFQILRDEKNRMVCLMQKKRQG